MADLQKVIGLAVAELEDEHYPDPTRGSGRQVCVTCSPQDGRWPCVTALIMADLKEAIQPSTDK